MFTMALELMDNLIGGVIVKMASHGEMKQFYKEHQAEFTNHMAQFGSPPLEDIILGKAFLPN